MPRISGAVVFILVAVFLPSVCALPRFPYAQSFLFSGPRDSTPAIHIAGEPFPDDVVSVELRESEGRAGLALQQQKMLEDLMMEQAPLERHLPDPKQEGNTGTIEQRSKREDHQRENDFQTGSGSKITDSLLPFSEHIDSQPTDGPHILGSEAEGHVMKPRHIEFGSSYVTKLTGSTEDVREDKSTTLDSRASSTLKKHEGKLNARHHRRQKAAAGGIRRLLRID